MITAILIFSIIAAIASIFLLIIILTRKKDSNDSLINKIVELGEDSKKIVKDEISQNRIETSDQNQKNRQELSISLSQFQESILKRIESLSGSQKDQLDSFSKQLLDLTKLNDKRLESIRTTVETKLSDIQKNNAEKLDEMRKTVDEKLQTTLEKRLGESFNIVSERLEQVHKGLGEMQSLAVGVGDLKRVLTNVKTRGSWGEIQLEALLDDILTKDQYSRNVKVNPSTDDIVEFALKLPGKLESDKSIWLPIDAKFPREDYERLIDAQETADADALATALKALQTGFKKEAKNISSKYIFPPYTTDFAIMFLPVEGLYAELMRSPGLLEELQRDYRVAVAGPSTLAAFLNSLQLGFRTLAIEKRSSEVWQLLGAVKTEFGKFGELLENTKKKLQAASNSIDTASRKTRTITRKLKGVQELPAESASLMISDSSQENEDEISN